MLPSLPSPPLLERLLTQIISHISRLSLSSIMMPPMVKTLRHCIHIVTWLFIPGGKPNRSNILEMKEVDQTKKNVASGLKKLKRIKILSIGMLQGKESTKELNSMSIQKPCTKEIYINYYLLSLTSLAHAKARKRDLKNIHST